MSSYVGSALCVCLLYLVTVRALEDHLMDDDRECRRHNNEGLCTFVDNDFTCGCLFHEKPLLTTSEWNKERNLRIFSQTCEQIKLPFHEDTCVVLIANPDDDDEYEFRCPDNGFFQTWGAFSPPKGSYNVRLWYRCCNVKCPRWDCVWSPFTGLNEKFMVPNNDVYVQGVKGRYGHESKDSSWSLQLCTCNTSSSGDVKEEL